MRKLAGVGLLGLAAVFAVTGRFILALPLAFFAATLLGRGIPFPGGFGPFAGNANKSPGQSSRVRTAFFEMSLDHDTGDMEGRVLQGAFAGQLLDSLDRDALLELWRECKSDPQSAQLFAAYLDRMDPEWRTEAGAEAGAEPNSAGGPMTVEEAYDVLGLAPGASNDDIRQAHRTLMKKLHPDQGGSTYLAAKINEAKDLLLGS